MDDSTAPRDPGVTDDPADEPTVLVGEPDDLTSPDGPVDDEMGRDPVTRPNPEHGPDVSLPVMTVSVAPNLGVGLDHDANSAIGTDAATSDFDDLFRAHYDRLVRSLTVAGGDREQAADAVQEAFVKAHVRWRRIGRYDDPIGWVRRVAINHLRDDQRRTRRKWGALARLAARTPASEQPAEPDELGRLLARLPRHQRIATALYYVDGLSVAEIATSLGLAEGTVKSHLHDARSRLRSVLDAERGSDAPR
jgi:RNA polymerase sigma-70 factor (ECF subfamily)